ncbi:exocyst complex component EXO70A1-like [Cornus florida]|uniref:exocyst complex component EXO70A1-like n=1 Tax=Cornus florida TaxID=4283 RepID=UPI002896DC77|nr:exocyst complex component EXO70A1-like [Cornus florida]
MGTPENVEVAYESAVKIILQWDASAARGKMIFDRGDSEEINQYLHAVDEIHRWMELTTVSDDDKSKANSVMEIAMAQLEQQFVNMLIEICHSSPMCSICSSSVTDSISYELLEEDYLDYDIPLSEKEISDLRSFAGRMKSVQRVNVYTRVRKGILDVRFRRLGVKKLSFEDVRRIEWDLLGVKIRQWIRAARVCVRVLFPKEKQLTEQIFGAHGTELCFIETVNDVAIQVFDFVEAISTSRPSPEKLFKFLDLHEALSELLPDVNTLFQFKTGEPIRIRAFEILSQLAEAIRGILAQLENAVCHELSTFLDPSGDIHSLTKYVMRYTIQISDYKESLTSLIVSKPSTNLRDYDDQMIPDMDFTAFEGRSTPLELHLIWIIEILVCKLEFKSKLYEDDTLGHLFMMNNVHYIVQSIKDCPELRMMIGDDYATKLIGKVQQTQSSYSSATWSEILSCLRYEGLGTGRSFSSGVSSTRSFFREKFKTFNAIFEEVHRTQATWLIPDKQLREELRMSISEELIPAYRSFLLLFRSHVVSEKHSETYINYSAEDLESALLEFFGSKEENLKLWFNIASNSGSVPKTKHKYKLANKKNVKKWFICSGCISMRGRLNLFGGLRIGSSMCGTSLDGTNY